MNGTLVILPQGFEEIEAVTPIDLLRRANLTVTVAALNPPVQVVGRSRLELMAEATLDDCLEKTYDAVVLIGGPGYVSYAQTPALMPFLQRHAKAKALLAAICAAPHALWDSGLLAGKRFTCHKAHREKLKGALDEAVVVDGKILTADGAGSSFAFGLKLVEILAGAEASEEIAKATGYRG